MIISQTQYHAEPEIDVSIYKISPSPEPFIVRVADGTVVHMSHDTAKLLHLQLTAALYEYDEEA